MILVAVWMIADEDLNAKPPHDQSGNRLADLGVGALLGFVVGAAAVGGLMIWRRLRDGDFHEIIDPLVLGGYPILIVGTVLGAVLGAIYGRPP